MRISVIIPSYNAAKTIGTTLASISAQSLKAFEIIVVDDGSCEDIAAAVAPFPKVLLLRQKNAGVSAARNHGARRATGDWLAFCDADDIWLPHKLASVAGCLNRLPQYDFLFHDFFLFDESGRISPRATHSKKTIFPYLAESHARLPDILTEHHSIPIVNSAGAKPALRTYGGDAFPHLVFGNFILPSTVVIRKDRFWQIGGFDPSFRSAEETEFFLRCARQMEFVYLDADLAGYRLAREGLTGDLVRLSTNGLRALLVNSVAEPARYVRYRDSIREAIGRRLARMAYLRLSRYENRLAFSLSLKALVSFPRQKRAWLCLIASLCPNFILRLAAMVKLRMQLQAN